MKLFYVDFQVDYARIYAVNTSSDAHKLGVCEASLDLIIGLRGTFTMRATRITLKRYWDGKRRGLGEKAVVEWLFHIAIDNLATAFKMSSKSFSYGSKTYNLMEFGFGQIRLSSTASLTE